MATIAVCPSCQSQLGVPAHASADALLQCPQCATQFVASAADLQELPLALIAETAPAPNAPIVSPATLEVDFDLGAPKPTTFTTPTAPETSASAPEFDSLPLPSTAAAPLQAPRGLAGSWPAEDFADDEFVDELVDDGFADERAADNHADDTVVEGMDFDLPGSPAAQRAGDHDFDLQPATRPRRRRPSIIRTLAGIVGGGIGGLLLAGYALLWLTNPQLDLFRMSQWLPPALLPKTAQVAEEARVRNDAPVKWAADEVDANAPVSDDVEPTDDASPLTETAATSDPENDSQQTDAEVTPASVNDPVAETPADEPTDSTPPAAALPPPRTPANWPSTPIVGDIVDPKFSSLAELTQSVTAADGAGREFLAGDLAQPESVRAMGQAYILLCEVAQRYTMTDPADYSPALFTQQALAKNLLRSVAGNVARRHDLDVIAARWWQHAKRTNDGILLVGRVRSMAPQGEWTQYELEIPLGEQVVVVPVLMERLAFATGAVAGVAGVIVTDPKRQIAGYDGEAPQVLIAGDLFDPAAYADAEPTDSPDFDLPGF